MITVIKSSAGNGIVWVEDICLSPHKKRLKTIFVALIMNYKYNMRFNMLICEKLKSEQV